MTCIFPLWGNIHKGPQMQAKPLFQVRLQHTAGLSVPGSPRSLLSWPLRVPFLLVESLFTYCGKLMGYTFLLSIWWLFLKRVEPRQSHASRVPGLARVCSQWEEKLLSTYRWSSHPGTRESKPMSFMCTVNSFSQGHLGHWKKKNAAFLIYWRTVRHS